MQPIRKHSGSKIPAIIDFDKRLADDETITAILIQPPVVKAGTGDDELVIGSAAILTDDVTLPDGTPSVSAGRGIQFDVSEGTNGKTYILQAKVRTSRGAEPELEVTLIVGDQF